MVAYGLLCGQTNEIYYGMNITETGYAEAVFRWKKGIRTPIWERKELNVIQKRLTTTWLPSAVGMTCVFTSMMSL